MINIIRFTILLLFSLGTVPLINSFIQKNNSVVKIQNCESLRIKSNKKVDSNLIFEILIMNCSNECLTFLTPPDINFRDNNSNFFIDLKNLSDSKVELDPVDFQSIHLKTKTLNLFELYEFKVNLKHFYQDLYPGKYSIQVYFTDLKYPETIHSFYSSNLIYFEIK